jgi:DNA invertase Pin-like site-specific DNA recombinase
MCLAIDVVLDVGRENSLSGSRIGYSRVSTVDQTLDQQNAALEAAGVTKFFSDTMSGARDDRPGLAELLAYAQLEKPPARF